MRPPLHTALPAGLDVDSLALTAGIGAGCLLFAGGFALWRRERTIEDTPASRVRSMALGRVALQGKAVPWVSDLLAPLSGVPCCWYRYRVEEERRSGRSRAWHTISSGYSAAWAFYLEDETGRVLVQPEGAELELSADLSVTRPDLDGPLGAPRSPWAALPPEAVVADIAVQLRGDGWWELLRPRPRLPLP